VLFLELIHTVTEDIVDVEAKAVVHQNDRAIDPMASRALKIRSGSDHVLFSHILVCDSYVNILNFRVCDFLELDPVRVVLPCRERTPQCPLYVVTIDRVKREKAIFQEVAQYIIAKVVFY
tara:strand:- start:10336 stop:10695 length:360 start_codon:yes stop_codon:yes gene_type:complete